eukprot:GHRR01028398.1.p1 GENE.GHRR01028398.1~~GHRR01028398.1.p1  ORF type:complete len:296 (+),score=112.78 GHRR01028398.1:467-1354(+)
MNSDTVLLLLAALAGCALAQNATAANATAGNTTGASNITDSRVTAYYSSPAFAIRQTPALSGLAGLAEDSSLGSALASQNLVATIFAPNNEAVQAALEYVQNATGADVATLQDAGVIDQLLSYHVASGAALVAQRLTDGQTLTMQDGNTTTITIVQPTRRLFLRRLSQAGADPVYYINSNSGQAIRVVQPNIQGGKSVLHVIDGVLVPQALLTQFNISAEGLPRYDPGRAVAATAVGAGASNAGLGNATVVDAQGNVVSTTGSGSSGADAAPGNNAAKAAAALLAVPALLAALMF